jgi:hypothetical protein
MLTPRIRQTSIFPHIYRAQSNYITVRAGSKNYGFGGTVHYVTGGYYHGSYDQQNKDYDVAILRVSTEFDNPIGILKYMMCLQ